MSGEHEDRNIVSLPLIRAWTEYADNLPLVWASLETAFAQADIPAALGSLHQFLVLLDHHSVRFPEIRASHASLSNDELSLLTGLCFAQHDRPEAVRTLLKKGSR